jgi:hypothetical protein
MTEGRICNIAKRKMDNRPAFPQAGTLSAEKKFST